MNATTNRKGQSPAARAEVFALEEVRPASSASAVAQGLCSTESGCGSSGGCGSGSCGSSDEPRRGIDGL